MSLTISKVPARDTRRGLSLFDILVTDADRHVMKLNPGVTYQLTDDHRQQPDLFTRREVNAIQVACRRGDYRCESRAVEGSGNRRRVWISFAPGWEPTPRNRKKKEDAS